MVGANPVGSLQFGRMSDVWLFLSAGKQMSDAISSGQGEGALKPKISCAMEICNRMTKIR